MSVTERGAAATRAGSPWEGVAGLVVRVRLAGPAHASAGAPLFDREIARDLPPGAAPSVAAILATLPDASPVQATPALDAPLTLSPPVIFCRALDGWVFFATPDHAAWRTLCMTFLNADVYRRFDTETAWRSAEVSHLAELALGTYAVDDLEGRCRTFAIPCVTVYDGRGPTEVAVRGGQIAYRQPSRPH